MLRILFLGFMLANLAPLLHAQEFGRVPSSDVPPEDPYPILTISHYAGHEGDRWQEFVQFDLDEWTPQKDVIISSKWIEPSGASSPGARAPGARDVDPFKARKRWVPTHRHWVIEYVDAVTEGESHLFINGVGLPKLSREIHSAEDRFGFAYIPGQGWYEIGRPARAYREFLRNRSQNPLDGTQPSPSDTQNPPETRSR